MGQTREKLMSHTFPHNEPLEYGSLLSFRHMYNVEYRPGEDELINYRVQRRKRMESTNPCPKCGDECECGPNCGCGSECECCGIVSENKGENLMKFKTFISEAIFKLDAKELASDLLPAGSAKIITAPKDVTTRAEVIGDEEFETKNGRVPALKLYARKKFKNQEVKIKKGDKLVRNVDGRYYGYTYRSGHFRTATNSKIFS
jgi:hypothetical protein